MGGANLEQRRHGGSQRPIEADTLKQAGISVPVVVFFWLSRSYSAFLRPCETAILLASDIIVSLINMQIFVPNLSLPPPPQGPSLVSILTMWQPEKKETTNQL